MGAELGAVLFCDSGDTVGELLLLVTADVGADVGPGVVSLIDEGDELTIPEVGAVVGPEVDRRIVD